MTPRTRMLVAGVILPLAIAAAAVTAMLLVLPTLPDPVAVHWGISGEPDRFGSPIGFLILVPVAVLGYTALVLVILRGSSSETVSQRIVLAVAPFFATVLGVMPAGGLVIQRGVADAHESPSILPILGLGFGGGIVLAVAAWFFLPAPAPLPELENLPTVALGVHERATWTRRLEPARWLGTVLVVVGALAVVAGGVAVWIAASVVVLVLYLLVVGILVLACVGSLFWTVRIDSHGLAARSVLGVPRFTVPLADVAAAASVAVDATSGFGGWGLRWGGRGRIGIILGARTALEVRRRSGGSLVITTADSERAAALLNSLAARVE